MVRLTPLVQASISAFCILIGWVVCVGGVGTLPSVKGKVTTGQGCVFISDNSGYVVAQERLGMEAVVLDAIILCKPVFLYGVWKQKYGIKRLMPLFALIISAILIVSANDLFFWTHAARTADPSSSQQTADSKNKMVNGFNAYLASVLFLVLALFARACLFTLDPNMWNPQRAGDAAKADTSPYADTSGLVEGGPDLVTRASF